MNSDCQAKLDQSTQHFANRSEIIDKLHIVVIEQIHQKIRRTVVNAIRNSFKRLREKKRNRISAVLYGAAALSCEP